VPLVFAPSVIQLATDDAVHAQLSCDAPMLMLPLPPAAAKLCVVGVTVNVHAAADCVTVNV
jgi:hypothetical protein